MEIGFIRCLQFVGKEIKSFVDLSFESGLLAR